MGCCNVKSTKRKKEKPNVIKTTDDTIIEKKIIDDKPTLEEKQNKYDKPTLEEKQNKYVKPTLEEKQNKFDKPTLEEKQNKFDKPTLEEKQNKFIEDFFKKELKPNEEDKRTSIFIKSQKKKIKVIKELIQIEDQFTLTIKTDPSKFATTFWYLLDEKISNIKSKQIYIDGEKVDDSDFEIDGGNIKLQFKPLFNQQTRDIKIIYEFPHITQNHFPVKLYLNVTDIVAQILVYTSKDYQIDDVTNNKYTFLKDLNIVYFEGKTTDDIKRTGYIHCSKRINYQIYKKIPNFEKEEENIIRNLKSIGKAGQFIIATYKSVKITDYGQEIEELKKLIGLNFAEGQFSSSLSIGFILNTKFEVDLVELNGEQIEYEKGDSSIKIKNLSIFNNQSFEVHLKYKYLTNTDKHVYRQESVITGNAKYSYCKLSIEIPDKYACLATDGVYKKDPAQNNKFVYDGITNEEQLYEKVKISIKKGVWNIQKEMTLTANSNITSCTFKINRLFKGGNLKEKSYEFIKDNAEFEDNKIEDRFIYNYKDLNTNKIKIGWKLKAENSTSDYKYDRGNELIIKVPDEDKQFFKDLANKILKEDTSNDQNYKKIGKWVHKYITYNLSYTGKQMSAREIYNTKIGVCEHFTKLYNTLLVSIGIDAVKVGGYALDRTEEDNKTMKVEESHIEFSKGVLLENERHAWSLAKINGVWTPLDATWNMFEGHVPLSHIFSNYGDAQTNIQYPAENEIESKIILESITFVG